MRVGARDLAVSSEARQGRGGVARGHIHVVQAPLYLVSSISQIVQPQIVQRVVAETAETVETRPAMPARDDTGQHGGPSKPPRSYFKAISDPFQRLLSNCTVKLRRVARGTHARRRLSPLGASAILAW